MNIMENKILIDKALALGAFKANVIRADEIKTDRIFRDICLSNGCGMCGKCYMCPPDVGDVEVLTAQLKNYKYALVYQTVSQLEDSFDIEGMTEAKQNFRPISQNLRSAFEEMGINNALHLGVGACGVCKVCAKRTGEPCRFPDLAMASLEAYCINVNELAKSAGMKYINGQNTVTYFGAVLFTPDGE